MSADTTANDFIHSSTNACIDVESDTEANVESVELTYRYADSTSDDRIANGRPHSNSSPSCALTQCVPDEEADELPLSFPQVPSHLCADCNIYSQVNSLCYSLTIEWFTTRSNSLSQSYVDDGTSICTYSPSDDAAIC